jgi:IS6 family transposase|nr:Mobilization_integration [Citrobacter werkmanii]
MDETYVKVNGRWAYLYRAVDSRGRTVDFISPPVVTAKLHTGFWVKSSTT